MTIQSKFAPIRVSCIDYVHPWTDSCSVATAEVIVQASQDSFRIYCGVYLLSLLMRGRIPTKKDLKRTILGILQSTAFLTSCAYTYSLILCIINRLAGSYNFFTFSYVPSFLCSVVSLLIERPSRRGLLSLYVTNVAVEALFRMAAVRGYVRPIPYGQVGIFGISMATLLYLFRKGYHKQYKDSMFDLIRFLVGDREEYGAINRPIKIEENRQSNSPTRYASRLGLIQQAVQYYVTLVDQCNLFKRHKSCPHLNNCASYVVKGGTKLFTVGLGINILLKLAFKIGTISKEGPGYLKQLLLNRDTLKMGIFLGGFTSTYRLISCLLRHFNGFDDPFYAIPAGLIASVSFASYPDITVALYIMLKMLQISYNIGEENEYLPHIPHFSFFLYCASTATLFHTATMEPLCLRPSYWRFLHSLSGGRIAAMERSVLDVYGLDTVKQLAETLKRTKTDGIIRLKFK